MLFSPLVNFEPPPTFCATSASSLSLIRTSSPCSLEKEMKELGGKQKKAIALSLSRTRPNSRHPPRRGEPPLLGPVPDLPEARAGEHGHRERIVPAPAVPPCSSAAAADKQRRGDASQRVQKHRRRRRGGRARRRRRRQGTVRRGQGRPEPAAVAARAGERRRRVEDGARRANRERLASRGRGGDEAGDARGELLGGGGEQRRVGITHDHAVDAGVGRPGVGGELRWSVGEEGRKERVSLLLQLLR